MAEVTIHSDFGGQESKMTHTWGKIKKLLTITTVCEDSLIFPFPSLTYALFPPPQL